MFQRGKDTPIPTYGFLVGIEIEDDSTTPEAVALRLADSVSWLEGVGKADVELLGKLDVYEEALVNLIEENQNGKAEV